MDTQRLILFFVFSFSLLLLWEAWQKESRPPPAPAAAAAPTGVPGPAASKAGSAAKPETVPSASAGAEAPGELLTVRTDTMLARVSTTGGDIVYLELLQHKSTLDGTKNFVLFDKEHRYAAESGLTGGLPYHRTVFTASAKEFEIAPGADKVDVRLEARTPSGVRVVKTLTFHRSSYLIDVGEDIVNGSSAPVSTTAYFQLTRDDKAPAGDPNMVKTFTGAAVYTNQDKFQKVAFSDIEKGKFAAKSADDGWAAMVQHYFVAALLPRDKVQREFYAQKLGEDFYSIGVKIPVGPIEAGGAANVSVPMYAGPEYQDQLKAIAPGLDRVVDYGMLTVIAEPLFWVLKIFHGWLGNWGLAIILLTICIKLLFFPLSAASYRSMAKMKLVTPRLAKIREQYADDRMKMNQAMMELYKTEKINPLGGCLPIVVQIPVFISLYWVLLASVELRHAPFYGWITDLSAEDPYYVLPALMMASMLLQTRMNPTPPDPVQAKVMLIMPFVFGVMFFFFPSGLVLYWLVNNILSIAQQWQITRMIEAKKPPKR